MIRPSVRCAWRPARRTKHGLMTISAATVCARARAVRNPTSCNTTSAARPRRSLSAQLSFGRKSRHVRLPRRCLPPFALAVIRPPRNAAHAPAENPRAGAEPAETFGALLPRYLAHKRAQLKPRSFEEVERHVLTRCRPLHSRPIGDIDQRAAAILLANIAERSGPRACNA